MGLGRWLKHACAISFVLLLHINASISLGHRQHANVTARCVEKERDALLAIKGDLVDDYNLLSSWRGEEDCCEWERVHCDHQTGHVIQLHLNGEYFSKHFHGKISPKIIELQYLEYLDLSLNFFNASRIPTLIGSLSSLRHLDLHFNFLTGSKIPELIGNLTNLRYLDLSRNAFGGEFPFFKFGNLTHLQYLNLGYLSESYAVETMDLNWLPHLSSLKYLDLNWSNLSKVSDWPETINKLPNLRNLSMAECDLPPPSISTHSHINSSNSLVHVELSGNSFGSPSIFKWLFNYNTTLVHLDLSFNQLSGLNPNVFANMNSLEYLDLSSNQLSGLNPNVFANMNSLEYLDLSFNQLSGLNPNVFANMNSLEYLDLSSNQLSGLIPNIFAKMSSLAYLDLSSNPLEGEIPASIAQLCKLQSLSISGSLLTGKLSEFVQRWSTCPHNSLQSLMLSNNNLAGSFPNFTNFSSLEELGFSHNKLSGIIPESIGKLSSLKKLFVSGNQMRGVIPKSIGELSSLYNLDLSGNILSGRIPESIGQLSSLEYLDLSRNHLSGKIPESIGKLSLLRVLILRENQLSGLPERIGQMSSLESLDISRNWLREKIPQSIGQLSNLYYMNLSLNHLEGEISGTHFSKLFSVRSLDLSQNSFLNFFNVTSDWTPPFQLYYLSLRSCKVGPNFPKWLRTQKSLSYLDMSNVGISEVFPSWLWGVFGKDFMENTLTIDLSNNQIRGILESAGAPSFAEVRLSSNQLEGPVPSFLSNALYLDLSHNKFSKVTSFLCSSKVKVAQFLDLSDNHIFGEVPDCLRHWVNLELLDLSNNSFSGIIPPSIGFLRQIKTLKLRSNQLVGKVPSSLKNCTNLNVIDLGDNHISSSVPDWLGLSLPNLVILMLQFNKLSGSLPSQLCHLARLQILDVSVNQITGTIPKCLNNLTSLAQEVNSNLTIRHPLEKTKVHFNSSESLYYEDDATFMWKGTLASYKSTLGLVKRIDLSCNRLTGEIPTEITHLVGLVALNLSRNKLTGQIPLDIGKLKSLDSLDLSRNKIGGGIPTGLAHINRLGALDLSYNNLSGEIPTGTQLQSFDASFFAGNPWLCGRPLDVCDPEGTGPPNGSSDQEDADELITQGFYISLGLGFAVGFWGVCATLIFKRSWRYAYYNFLNSLNDWLYVRVALIRRKLKELLIRQS